MKRLQLTLRQKIGQLLVIGMYQDDATPFALDTLKHYVSTGEVGGFIPYSYNIQSPDQIRSLNLALSDTAKHSQLPGFLLTVDVEGGKVDRLSEAKGFGSAIPSAAAVAHMSTEEAHDTYARMVKKVIDSGFNWVYAPDVDMNPDGYTCPVIGGLDRSYGSDTAAIVRYASVLVEEARKVGLLTCAKHFPGHGSAKNDSHQGFTDVTRVWNERELDPFFELNKKGLLDSVMTGHLFNEHLDKDNQATMSHVTLQLLRKAGFDGVIVSDDLHMGAVQQKCTFEESIVKAFQAGVDMIIFSNNPKAAGGVVGFKPDPDLPKKFCDVVEAAIAQNQLSEDRIEEAFQRVIKLKSRLPV